MNTDSLESLQNKIHALERENELQRKALSGLSQLISYVDRDLRYRFASTAYENWFVPPKSNIIGLHVRDVIGEESLRRVFPMMERALAGELVEFEIVFPFGEGLVRTVGAKYIPEINSSGEVLGFHVILTDLAEREQGRHRLAESEDRAQLIFNHAPVGIIQLDEERRYLSANATYCRYLGYTIEELRGMTMFQVTHPDDLAQTKQASESFSDPGFSMRRFEKRYVRKDGEVVWGLVTSEQYTDPSTGRNNLFSVIEDITDIKKRELEVKQAEAEITHFFAASLDLMCVIGNNGFLKRVNPAFTAIFGFSSEELLTTPLLEFVHPEDRMNVLEELEKLSRGIPTLQFECRSRTKDGAYRLLSWIGAPDTNTGLIFASARDITELKQAEVKLAQSAKMASLGEMAGGIAHEINNPLAIILGKITVLKTYLKRPNPEFTFLEEEISGIEMTGLRIAKIIRGLRAFSRNADADPMTKVAVSQIIDDTLQLCAQRLKNRDINLTINCPPELTINCRPSQLCQVLMNLLSNAYDAVEDKKSPWIRINVEKLNRSVLLSVEDCGKGIEPQVQAKMMQPFFTKKEVGKGTGLGLSISKGIVEDHHGQLRYDDSTGHTRFIVELPL